MAPVGSIELPLHEESELVALYIIRFAHGQTRLSESYCWEGKVKHTPKKKDSGQQGHDHSNQNQPVIPSKSYPCGYSCIEAEDDSYDGQHDDQSPDGDSSRLFIISVIIADKQRSVAHRLARRLLPGLYLAYRQGPVMQESTQS